MDANGSQLPTVEAAYADAAQAERAVAELQQHGVDSDRIDIEHGGTARPGTTAAADRAIADRMAGSWAIGAASGTVVGAVLGAVIGTITSGAGTSVFWALVIGLGAALGGVGTLWGLFAGFARRDTQQAGSGDQPELRDAVRVVVRTKPGEGDDVRRILARKGGA